MIGQKEPEMTSSKTITIVAEGVKIEGRIFSLGSTRIDGNVRGEIVSAGELIIGKEGSVEADIKTKNSTIAGSFKGKMIASGEVEITATGKFIGSLVQKDAMLTVQKGGLFKGESTISEDQSIFKIEDIQKKAPKEIKL